MPVNAIEVEGIGKQYRIGARRDRPQTLREALMRSISAPLHNLRHLRSLGSTTGDAENLFWALRDVSFKVAEGEVLGIIGRNGAGKSTLLKILSRITYPTTGHARVQGRLGSLLEVGTGFHPELTGRDNIYLNGCILGMDRAYITKHFDEIVEFADVPLFLDTPVKHYSSGMYVRLAFAVAAHLGSEVLIVDEVLAVGDAEFQAKCLAKLNEVATEGRTILFVSHNLNAIQRMCPRSILLEAGQVVADGPTADVAQRYLVRTPSTPEARCWIDLSAANRAGSREVLFEAARFSSDCGPLGYRPYPDGPLELALAIRSDLRRTLGGIGLAILGAGGAKLLSVDTQSLGLATPVDKGRTVLGLRIDSLHLNPGTYTVSLWATGPLGRRIFDRVDAAFVLQVVDPAPEISNGHRLGPTTCRFEVLPQDAVAD